MADTPVYATHNFPPELLAKLTPVLSSGNFHHGDNLETIGNGCSSAKLYSLRLNRKSRVMLARVVVNGVSSWLLIEELVNHNYKDAQSLKKGWLDQYLKKHGANLAKEQSDVLCSLEEQNDASIGELEYHNEHWVVLTDEQNQAHSANYPLIVPGMPGTGKSVLALSLLKRALDNDDNDSEVVYVTKSKDLADRMRGILEDTPELEAKPTVIDFASLPAEMRGQSEGAATGETECMSWLSQEKLNLSWKTLGYASPEQLHRYLYREFRILSGCQNEEAYLALGRRQSLFDETERGEIYKIYARYITSDQGCRDYSLIRIKPTTEQRYSAMFVDESQDFSDAELLDLYDLCDGRIVYLIDSNQSLLDVHSKIDALKRRLGRELTVIILPYSFRCSHSVARAANAILNTKHQATGGVLEKNAETQVKNHEGAAEGQAIWVEHDHNKPHAEHAGIDSLKQTMNSTQRIVITWPKYFAEVKRLFPGAIVATPEQVKGLEYDEVVTYHLLDEEYFAPISRLLPAEGTAPAFFEKGSRAKAENDRRELAPELNQVFTAFTRARQTLYVIENSNAHKTKTLTQRIKQAFTQNEIKSELKASSIEEWRKQAQRYIKEKRYDLAKQICDTHLGAGVYDELVPVKTDDNTCASSSTTTKNSAKKSTPVVKSDSKKSKNKPKTTTKEHPTEQNHTVANKASARKPKRVLHAIEPSLWLQIIKKGNLATIKMQVEGGADLNQKLPGGMTALMLAVQYNKLEIIKYLVQQGANLDTLNDYGGGAIHLAISEKNLDVVRYLHEQGAALDQSTVHGNKTLSHAIVNEDLNTIIYLQQIGFNLDLEDETGLPPIARAIRGNRMRSVEYLCDAKANVNQDTSTGEFPLMIAAYSGHLHAVKTLHRYGAKLDKTSQRGSAAIHCAVREGHMHIVKYLVENGADKNLMETEGGTALHIAVAFNRPEIVQYLVDQGVNVDALDDGSFTPLHLAVIKNNPAIAALLLKSGANSSLPCKDGETPLHTAAKLGQIGLVCQLMKFKANVNQANADGFNPIHCAANVNILKVLKQDANLDLNAKDNYGYTPVNNAVHKGSLDQVKYLTEECGADLNLTNNLGHNPLATAFFSGHKQIASYLLQLEQIDKSPIVTPKRLFEEMIEQSPQPELKCRLQHILDHKTSSQTTQPSAPFFNTPEHSVRNEITLGLAELAWMSGHDDLLDLLPVPDYLLDDTSPANTSQQQA